MAVVPAGDGRGPALRGPGTPAPPEPERGVPGHQRLPAGVALPPHAAHRHGRQERRHRHLRAAGQ